MSESSNSKDKIVSESGSDSPKQEEKATEPRTEENAIPPSEPINGALEEVQAAGQSPEGEQQAQTPQQVSPAQPRPISLEERMLNQTQVIAQWTRIMGVAAVVAFMVAGLQFCAIQSTVRQNERLITATKEQANASLTQANASMIQANTSITQANAAERSARSGEISANTSQTLVDQNEDMVSAAETQANTSQVSARAAERSASIAQIGLLPRIEAKSVIVSFEKNRELEVRVEFTNKGGTTALNFIAQSRFLVAQVTAKPLARSAPSVSHLSPQMSTGNVLKSSIKISSETEEALKVGLRVWAWGVYDDEFGGRTHRFAFCWAFSKQMGTLVHCTREQYNEWKPTYDWD